MAPVIKPRDFLLMCPNSHVRVGDLVVANIEAIGLVIKRLHNVEEGHVVLRGDNLTQESSTCNRLLKSSVIVGKVRARFRFPFYFRFFL